MSIEIKVSYGELIDKYTILLIKNNRMYGNNFILQELEYLKTKVMEIIPDIYHSPFIQDLIEVNLTIWDLEDRIRELEKLGSFGEEFIQVARSIYKMNDKRFEIKNQINKETQSNFREQKLLPAYDKEGRE